MRRLFTTSDAYARGITQAMLRWGVKSGRWVRVAKGVYAEGAQPPLPLELALAKVMQMNGVAGGTLAGVMYELDSVQLKKEPPWRIPEYAVVEVAGHRCSNGTRTMVDLALHLDDLYWEQALESALRKRITTIPEIRAELLPGRMRRAKGSGRIERVLALRGDNVPPTESLLETLMVQLVRGAPDVPPPTRQVEVHNEYGRFVARVDLAWPEAGLFLELDGQQHKGQPLYDASLETSVVAATGWLPGRFTWYEVARTPKVTLRKVCALYEQAMRRYDLPDAS